MRALGLGLLLAAAGLGWLSFGDRSSALALNIVEWDGRLGFPVAALVGAAGLLLLALGGGRSSPAPRAPAPSSAVTVTGRTARPLGVAPPLSEEGWLSALQGRAGELKLEAGTAVVIDPARTPPVILVLERVTPERARRTVEVFAEFLSTIPTPPRAALEFRQCPVVGPPRPAMVNAALRRYFAADDLVVTQHEDTVDLVFRSPDGRWRALGRSPGRAV